MRTLVGRTYDWWIAAWRGDPFASDLAMQGEHRVARARVLAVGSLTALNIGVLLADPGNGLFLDSLPINVTATVFSLLVLFVTRRGIRPRLLSLTTVVADVSAVSMLHVLDLMRGLPSVVLNGRVTFSAYFLAMVGTCARLNPTLAGLSGVVAASQYAAIAAWGIAIWPATPTDDVVRHGWYDWGVQAERVLTLLVFGGLCASISRWAVALGSSATHDPLTGLLNRRTFEEQLHSAMLRVQRNGDPIGVAMIDVDHFKRVNDTHGHHAGDLVLQRVASLLRDAVRRTDLVGRWGGEEFTLVFPSEGPDSTAVYVERVRAAVATSPIDLPHGARVSVTLSAGVAVSPQDGTNAATLIQIADARLLEAKRSGRNRMVVDRRPVMGTGLAATSASPSG